MGQKPHTPDRQVRSKVIEPHLPDPLLSKQCALLSIIWSSFYYAPKGGAAINLDPIRRIHCPAGAACGDETG
jgi:hypothetical protein